MTKLKVAIIGCKNMGRKHLNILREHFADEVEIAGILNSRPETTTAAAKELGVKAFASLDDITLQNVDAAIISTPAESHFAITKELLQRHIPLLVEKPFAISTAECLELKQLAEQNKTAVLVGHTENYNPAVIAMLQDIRRPVKSIEGIRTSCNPGFKETHVISELMIHDLAIVNALLPQTPNHEKVSKDSRYRWDEQAIVELEYADGATVKIEAVRADVPIERWMKMVDANDTLYEIRFRERQLLKNGREISCSGDSLVSEIGDFLSMVQNGTRPHISLEEACDNVALCNQLEAKCQTNPQQQVNPALINNIMKTLKSKA